MSPDRPKGASPIADSVATRPRAAGAIKEAERRDLIESLAVTRKAARRHTFWAAMGVSPGAALPLFFSLSEVGLVGVVAASGVVAALEAWRAVKANRKADDIAERLASLEAASFNPSPGE